MTSRRSRILTDSDLNRARARAARHDWGGMTPVSAIDEQRPCRQDARKSSGFYFNGQEVCCFYGVPRDKHRHSTLVKAA